METRADRRRVVGRLWRPAVLLLLAAAATCRAPAAEPAAPSTTGAGATAPPAILLANVYSGQVDVRQYLVSEKFDGVRAIWDGQTLRFRSGREVPAPAWFTARLPRVPLDGELWLGRGRFDALSAAVRRDPPDEAEWRDVRYLIFELPGGEGPFAERARRIVQVVRDAAWPALQAVDQTAVADPGELQRRLKGTVAQGGEGLMLHRADAAYSTGRSDVLLKLKPYLDSEATVVGQRAGKGRHAGRMGALHVQLPDGRRFWLGTGFSDAQRDEPPPVGSVVTYRFRDLTSTGLPRFASFLRVRDEP